MRVFQMVMAVLFCAALTFYLWVAVPRVQAQDTSMPVLTDETGGELALSVTAPESAYCAGLHAEDARDGDLTDEICIAGMSALLDGDRRRIKYVVFDADCHAATLTRTVRYTDYNPPRFALNVPSTYRTGEMPALLAQITAEDVMDGDVSDRIRLFTEDITFVENDMYSLPVSVTNSYGGQSEMQLYMQLSDKIGRAHV